MKQAVLSALALALVATPTSTYVASTSVDCGSTYVSFLERISRRGAAMSGDQLAALHRGSLRIFLTQPLARAFLVTAAVVVLLPFVIPKIKSLRQKLAAPGGIE